MNFDLNYFFNVSLDLTKYIKLTLYMATISTAIGLVIALVLATIRFFKIRGLYELSNVYISFFRGTPLLVQLFIFYYGLPQSIKALRNVTPLTAMIVGLSMCGSAYMAEIIRGALDSVDKGQMEAALSVGMTRSQALRRIIFPQAIRVAIPGIGNTFVDLLKSSSLAFVLGLTEILARAQMAAASSFKVMESYLSIAIIYWIIVEGFNFLQKLLEKKLAKAY
ncbi:amino acid ABC transporter permease [Clostridium frigidicarnis]|uniref:Amino acid ABC transporter membrane protein, PAAT family n=1 Tax=Clostridium frigidicarnis TaxID=84698 RepID=A0A1I0V7Y2_9CLOT|nr:amino acid ABC transporter permease [Clostridium frigidicarnis]SFA72469.1 amino acid ABC transporter membrane protein, PAAT family [Clostridium frigidicarnis]